MGDPEPTPKHVVVDSSVAVKWFLADEEAGVGQALTLLEDHEHGSVLLSAPAHMPLEVLSAVRSRGSDEARLVRLAHALDGFELRLFALELLLLEAACRLAGAKRLTLYDAAFLALAETLDCPIVTADRRLADAAGARGQLLGEPLPG